MKESVRYPYSSELWPSEYERAPPPLLASKKTSQRSELEFVAPTQSNSKLIPSGCALSFRRMQYGWRESAMSVLNLYRALGYMRDGIHR